MMTVCECEGRAYTFQGSLGVRSCSVNKYYSLTQDKAKGSSPGYHWDGSSDLPLVTPAIQKQDYPYWYKLKIHIYLLANNLPPPPNESIFFIVDITVVKTGKQMPFINVQCAGVWMSCLECSSKVQTQREDRKSVFTRGTLSGPGAPRKRADLF